MTESNGSQVSTETTGLSVERTLGQRIHVFSNMTSGNYYGRSELVFGVSLPEWRVLRAVLLQPEVSQVAVAAAEGLNVMNVSRAVAGLRRKTLIDVRTDPDDGRRSLLLATSLGEEIGTEIAAREQLVYETVFAALAADEIEQLDTFLALVNQRLRDVGLPDPPPPSRDWVAVLDEVARTSDAT